MGHKHKKDKKKKKKHHHHRSDSSDSNKSDNYGGLFSDSDNDDMKSEELDELMKEIDSSSEKDVKKKPKPSPLHYSVQPPPKASELAESTEQNVENEPNTENEPPQEHMRVSKMIREINALITPKPQEELSSKSSSSLLEVEPKDKHKHKHKKIVEDEDEEEEEDDDEDDDKKSNEKHIKPSEENETTNSQEGRRVSELLRSLNKLTTPKPPEELPLPLKSSSSSSLNKKSKDKQKHKKHHKEEEEEEEEEEDDDDDVFDLEKFSSSSSSSKPKHKSLSINIEAQQQQQEEPPQTTTTTTIPSARKRPQSARHYQNIQQPLPPSSNQPISRKSTFSNQSFSNPSFSESDEIQLNGHANDNNRSNSFRSNGSKSVKESENQTLPEHKAVILQSNPALNSEIQPLSPQPKPPIQPSSRRPVSFHTNQSITSEKSEESVKELSSKNQNLIQRDYESERTNQISSLRSMETVKPLIQTSLNDKTKWKFDIFRKKLEIKEDNNNRENNNNIFAPLKQTSEKKNQYYDKASKPQVRIPPRGTVAYVHYMKSIQCTCPPKLKSICTIDHPCKGCARSNALYGMNIEREGCSYNPVITLLQASGGNGNSDNFIQRQDNNIKMTTKEKMKRDAVAEYESKIIKECPICKSKQTYDMFVSGKNKCQNCNKKFQFPRGWNDVKKEFWKRNDDFIKRKKDKRVVERDVYDYKYGITYYCRVCKKAQSLNEYMSHQMKCPLGHPYIPQYSNYEINDKEEEEEENEEVKS